MEKKVGIPDGVQVKIQGMSVVVRGPKDELARDFNDPRFNGLVRIEQKDSHVYVSNSDEKRKTGAVVGTVAAHIRNMILGATVGFKYEMKILYTHFPITVAQSGDEVQIKNFFGEKSLRTAKIVGRTEVKIDKELVTLTGNSIEEVGQTAANIERACKLTGRDRRIFQDGIYITSRRLATGEAI